MADGRGIASIHIADLGLRSALKVVRRAPAPGSVPGLRHADVAFAGPLSPSALPRPSFGRVALIAFWDDDGAVDRFLADHPLAGALGAGWHARLEPIRAFGAWPGLDEDISRERSADREGPAVVLTFGRLRLGQSLRFLRAGAIAQASALAAPGMIWGTGLSRPPFVATCSVWESARAITAYAYAGGGHPAAIEADRAKPFHHRSAFVRFRPYGISGGLAGENPLPEQIIAPA